VEFKFGYRNAYYDNHLGVMRIAGWNADGERCETDIPFQPYIYIENTSTQSNVKSIFKTHLQKREFKNGWVEYRKF